MDLPLTRASSALDRLADMTEDVCKEYRGCCIGMRFLHPVWFIDEVELADCDYTRRTTVNGAEKLLKQLFFQPFFYDNCYRRKLTLQEISTYQSRQRLRCPPATQPAVRLHGSTQSGTHPGHTPQEGYTGPGGLAGETIGVESLVSS